MKKTIALTLFLSLFFSFLLVAEKSKKIKQVDGSIVIETIFTEKDNEYKFEKEISHFDHKNNKLKDIRFLLPNNYTKLGVSKTVENFSTGNRRTSIELYFSEDKAFSLGYQKIELFLDPKGNRKRMEVFFINDSSSEKIYERSKIFYNSMGVKIGVEHYFTKKASVITGYFKLVERFDRSGQIILQKFYDRQGNAF